MHHCTQEFVALDRFFSVADTVGMLAVSPADHNKHSSHNSHESKLSNSEEFLSSNLLARTSTSCT